MVPATIRFIDPSSFLFMVCIHLKSGLQATLPSVRNSVGGVLKATTLSDNPPAWSGAQYCPLALPSDKGILSSVLGTFQTFETVLKSAHLTL